MHNGVCVKAEIRDYLLVISEKVGNKNEEVLEDSGCNGVIVKRELVHEADFIEKVGYMTVDRTLIEASIVTIKVDTPFYTGTVEAMCMKDSLLDLIIGLLEMFWEPGSQMIRIHCVE